MLDQKAPVMEKNDESVVIKRAQNGDRNAFEALLRAHYNVMYRIAYKWSGNQIDAEDITQNACIKLARSIGTYRFQAAFSTWLYRLVVNVAKDSMKSRARYVDAANVEAILVEPATAENSVYVSQIMAHIRTFPDREQEALYLVFSDGLTHRDAAVVMECKESTVSWYIHEARKKLQSFKQSERRHG